MACVQRSFWVFSVTGVSMNALVKANVQGASQAVRQYFEVVRESMFETGGCQQAAS